MPRPTLDPHRAAEMGRAGGRAKKIEAVERRIKELVDDDVVPLTVEQRDRLALLLRGAAA